MQCVCTVQCSTVQCTVVGCVVVRPGPEPRLEPRYHSGSGRESRQSPSDTETSQTQIQRIQSHIPPPHTTLHSSIYQLSASGGCAAAPPPSICSVHSQYGAQEED